MSRTISMYIFKSPKFREEFNEINKDIEQYISNGNLSFQFVERGKIGNIIGWAYLNSDNRYDNMEFERILFKIHSEFFPNEVAYISSEGELEDGYQNLIYNNGKRVYIGMWDDFSHWIRKMFQKYDEGYT